MASPCLYFLPLRLDASVPDGCEKGSIISAILRAVLCGEFADGVVKRLAGAILIEGDVAERDAVVVEGVQSVRAGVALRRLDAENHATGVGD